MNPFEKLPNEPPKFSDSPEAQKKDGLTRRDFLKGIIGLAGSVAIDRIHKGSAEAKEPEKQLENYPYGKWLGDMKKSALEKDREINESYVHFKNGEGKLLRTEQQERFIGSVESDRSEIYRILEKELKDGKVETIQAAHTHPLASCEKAYQLTKDVIENILTGKQRFSVPPSISDIGRNKNRVVDFKTERLREESGLKSSQVEYLVFDPSGIWKYRKFDPTELPLGSNEQKEFLGRQEIIEKWEGNFLSAMEKMKPEEKVEFFRQAGPETGKAEIIQKFYEGKTSGINPDNDIRQYLEAYKSEDNEKFARIVFKDNESIEWHKKYIDQMKDDQKKETVLTSSIRDFVMKAKQQGLVSQDYDNLCLEYRKLGLKVSFIPYGEMEQ